MENKINKTENKKKTWSKPELYTPLEIRKTFDLPETYGDDGWDGYLS
jgi:hypothetical protein